jgi:predicted nucleotidyltransferase
VDSQKFREGDFIETIEGLIFDVKGLVHPPNRIIAYVRYIPNEKGERRRGDSRYRKVYSLKLREQFLKREYPHYVVVDPVFHEQMSEVPINHIIHHYQPLDTVRQLRRNEKRDDVENEALQFLTLLVEASDISQRTIGISGSIMVDLHVSASDLDIIVYGTQNCFKVHNTLRKCFASEKGLIRAYDLGEIKKLYSFRVKDTPMSFQEFYRHAIRKSSQGTYRGRDFSIRFLKDWDEIKEKYGETVYRSFGQRVIKAKVRDDSEALFTPCRYVVGDVEFLEGKSVSFVKEVVSFRGRFCQHVKKGETIIVRGKMESVKTQKENYFRILVGGTAEDYMVSMWEDVVDKKV